MPSYRHLLLGLLLLAMAPAHAQLSGPPSGGPTGQFLGPPTGNAGDFLGVWDLTWDGPMGTNCPCRGTLTISTNNSGELQGVWKSTGPAATLTGSVGYNQDVWTGRFAQSDDADFPIRGHFRLESRGERSLTGSYQPDGTAIPFSWAGTRL
jgi:hypothetical protein